MIRSPSLTVGTSPFGFMLRYSGSRLPPNGPPTSARSNSMPSSAQHHSTFCTFDEVERPQIFSIVAAPSGRVRYGASVGPMAQLSSAQPSTGRSAYNWKDAHRPDEGRMNRLAPALLVALPIALLPAAAGASQQGAIATKKWK